MLRVEEALSLTFESIDALPNESVFVFSRLIDQQILMACDQGHTLMSTLVHVKMHRQVFPRGCASVQMIATPGYAQSVL